MKIQNVTPILTSSPQERYLSLRGLRPITGQNPPRMNHKLKRTLNKTPQFLLFNLKKYNLFAIPISRSIQILHFQAILEQPRWRNKAHYSYNFKKKKKTTLRERKQKGLLKLKSNNIKQQPQQQKSTSEKMKAQHKQNHLFIDLGFTKNAFPSQFKNQK